MEKYGTNVTKNSCYYKRTTKTKGEYTMLTKVGIVTALTTALLFGGFSQQSVEASANADHTQNNIYKKVYYSINGKWQEGSWDEVEGFLNNVMSKWYKYGKTNNWEQKEQPKVEQPKEETPKQEQPKEEAPAPEQPKQEQPKEEAPAPQQPKQEQPKQQESNQGQQYQLNQYEQQVVELTNNERAKQGLQPLKVDWELSRVAREKSRDMANNGYFAHNSPTYGSPFDMMRSYGISYRTAGENIAKGQRTPQEVVNAWMNSSGHRANILNGNFTHIGVGFVEQGNHWTQQFIGK